MTTRHFHCRKVTDVTNEISYDDRSGFMLLPLKYETIAAVYKRDILSLALKRLIYLIFSLVS